MDDNEKMVTVAAKISSADKLTFDDFCKQTGLNTSVAINMFIKYVNREKRIPFPIELVSK